MRSNVTAPYYGFVRQAWLHNKKSNKELILFSVTFLSLSLLTEF